MYMRLRLLACLLALSTPASAAEKFRLGDLGEKPDPVRTPAPPAETLSPERRGQMMSELAEEFYQKGLSALDAGRKSEARACFTRAVALDPTHEDAAAGLERLSDIEKPAPPPPTKGKGPAKPTAEDRLFRQFQREANAGRLEAAIEIGERILLVDPKRSGVKEKVGAMSRTLAERAAVRAEKARAAGDLSVAIAAYETSVRYNPSPSVLEALVQARSAREKDSRRRAQDTYIEALLASQKGSNDRALRLCRRAIELDPTHLQAQRMLDRLKRQTP
jgi:tetratricopeptide (TPR) repeat protein